MGDAGLRLEGGSPGPGSVAGSGSVSGSGSGSGSPVIFGLSCPPPPAPTCAALDLTASTALYSVSSSDAWPPCLALPHGEAPPTPTSLSLQTRPANGERQAL